MRNVDDKITLDRKSFEALAADTRVRILKFLAERRKTLSELAAQLGLSPSTVKEHMVVLQEADLVSLSDEGRKWKYYELTWKGRNIVQPRELRIWIVLSISMLAMIAALFNFYSKLSVRTQAIGQVMKAGDENAGEMMAGAAAEGARSAMVEQVMEAPAAAPAPIEPTAAVDLAGTLLPDLVLMLAAAMLFGVLLGYLIKRKA